MAKCKMCGEILIEDEENFCCFCQSRWDIEEQEINAFTSQQIEAAEAITRGSRINFV